MAKDDNDNPVPEVPEDFPLLSSNTVNKLIPDLVDMLNEEDDPIRDRVNPAFKSRYTDLDSVLAVVRRLGKAHNIALLQAETGQDSSSVCIRSVLLHKSGEWIAMDTILPLVKVDPQGHGSAVTYARRYGAVTITGRAPEDDDGNAASARPVQPKEPGITDDQAIELAALIRDAHADGDRFRAFFGFTGDLANFPQSRFAEAVRRLREQARALAAKGEATP